MLSWVEHEKSVITSGPESIHYTMMKYEGTFYGRHTAFSTVKVNKFWEEGAIWKQVTD